VASRGDVRNTDEYKEANSYLSGLFVVLNSVRY